MSILTQLLLSRLVDIMANHSSLQPPPLRLSSISLEQTDSGADKNVILTHVKNMNNIPLKMWNNRHFDIYLFNSRFPNGANFSFLYGLVENCYFMKLYMNR